MLTYHVVPERLTWADLKNRIDAGKGMTTLKTAAGGTLVAMSNGPSHVVIKDAKGGVANISVYDVIQSNGVIHSVDKVLLS